MKEKPTDRPNTESGLVARTARRLAESLPLEPGALLPSVPELCALLRVSRGTLLKAVQSLTERGLVEAGRGRRMRVPGEEGPVYTQSACRSSAASRWKQQVEVEIREGILKSGSSFPKIAYLVAIHRGSPRDFIDALRRLETKGLAHREGRTWKAGPQPMPRKSMTRDPFIFILQVASSNGPTLHGERSSRFLQAFSEEAYARGIRLRPLADVPVETTGIPAIQDVAGLKKKLRDQGGWYMGTLIAGGRAQFPNLSRWFGILSDLRRPVAWFDRFDEGLGSPYPALPAKQFARGYFRERDGVKSAADFLRERGHVRIGFLASREDPWIVQRHRLLMEAFSASGARMEFITAFPRHALALNQAHEVLKREGVHVPSVPGADKLAQPLGQLAALLSAQVTVLVVPDDYSAEWCHGLLDKLQLEVPGRISLLSFDNLHLRLPVTSVDWGLGQLGYLAFHHLLGDIPLRRNRQGDIVVCPKVVDKDTVADLHTRRNLHRFPGGNRSRMD